MREVKLGEVCHITDGAHSKVERQESGLLYLTSKNIKKGELDLSNVDYISETDFDRLFPEKSKAGRRPKTGDILIGIIGTFGNAYVYKKEDSFGMSSSVGLIRPNEDELDSDFLYYVITGRRFSALIDSFKSGSVQGYTNIPTLKQIPFSIPPLPEQKAIAGILGKLDDKIELNRQMNQTLEQMAQALFQSWFVDFDPVIDNALAQGNEIPEALAQKAENRKAVLNNPLLGGDKGVGTLPEDLKQLFPNKFTFNDTLNKWIPEGWEGTDMTKCLDTISKTYKLKEVEEIIFLNTGDIEEGRFLHNDYSETKGLPGQAKKSIQEGDILYSEIRPKNKRFAYVYFDSSDYVVSTKLMVLRPKNDVDALFYYQILKSESTLTELQFLAESRSGTFPQITYDTLNAINFVLPNSKETMDHYVNFLKTNFDRSIENQKQTETLTQLRDVLLPQLISGKLPVPEAMLLIDQY